jgi:hypothetical protein
MKYVKGFFYLFLIMCTVFSCLVALGFLIMLIQDYWNYNALGKNLNDTFSITCLCAMNACVCGLVSGLFKV